MTRRSFPDMPTTADKLKALRTRASFSMEELAKKLGYAASSSYQRYESADNYRKKKFLNMDMGEKLVSALVGLGTPPIKEDEVLELCGVTPRSNHLPRATGTGQSASLSGEAHIPRSSRSDDLPVRGFLKQGEHGYFFENGQVSDFIARPPELQGADEAYAMQLRDYSMTPFEPGWYATFDPRKPVRAGDLVAIYLKDGQAMFKKLIKMNAKEVVVRQYEPLKDLTFQMSEVDKIHRFATIHAERP